MHTPKHSLIFLSAILGVLGLLMLIFPEDGIKITNNFTLRFLTISEFIPSEENSYADISHLIDDPDLNETDSSIADVEIKVDTLVSKKDTLVDIDTIRANASKLKTSIHKIQFQYSDASVLYPFFRAMRKSLKDSTTIRVMHYGDSQIEGDRITSIIRNNLQTEFGGYGAGLLSAYEENSYASQLAVEHTGNWERHTRYGIKDSLVHHNRYGALLNFCRYSPIVQEGETLDTSVVNTASIAISKKGNFYRKKRFRYCKVYYSNCNYPVTINFIHKDSLIKSVTSTPKTNLAVAEVDLGEYSDNITIAFSSIDSPDIFGISLEGEYGVIVDNVPLRGSSGLEFTRSNTAMLSQMYKKLNVNLILMEFGVNVVPNIVDDYSFYKKSFSRQINKLKAIMPNVPIIVIGVSDMSQKKGLYYESYPNIEKIRNAQKKAAFETGCGFWDMYKAMGGNNSMPSWVFAKPPLAQKDFTHFNYRGSKIVANMFFNAFHYEYKEWEKLTKPQQREKDSVLEDKAKGTQKDTLHKEIN